MTRTRVKIESMKIGEKIREARKQMPSITCEHCGATSKKNRQSDIAKACMVSRAYMSMVEGGYEVPTNKVVILAAKYLQKPLSYFVDGQQLGECEELEKVLKKQFEEMAKRFERL